MGRLVNVCSLAYYTRSVYSGFIYEVLIKYGKMIFREKKTKYIIMSQGKYLNNNGEWSSFRIRAKVYDDETEARADAALYGGTVTYA